MEGGGRGGGGVRGQVVEGGRGRMKRDVGGRGYFFV